jgi:serine/threonine protein kinase
MPRLNFRVGSRGPEIVGGRYLLSKGEPARGSSAVVLRARDYETDQTVAVKLYQSDPSSSELLTELFERERETLSALNHPNIVRLLDAGYDAARSQQYIVLEWFPESLPSRVERAPFPGWDEFVDAILLPLLESLRPSSNAWWPRIPTTDLTRVEWLCRSCRSSVVAARLTSRGSLGYRCN